MQSFKPLPQFLASLTFLSTLAVGVLGASGGAGEGAQAEGLAASRLGVSIPVEGAVGKWALVSSYGGGREGYLSEVWRWDGESDGQADFTVRAEYKKHVPPPPASEVARAFERAASRVSYASTVVDSEISPEEQWVEYSLPTQGEGGVKKIMRLKDGYVVLTLSTSDKFDAGEGSPERSTWNSLVEGLKKAQVVEP